MKKLQKKMLQRNDTLEAYIYCDCICGCSCNCYAWFIDYYGTRDNTQSYNLNNNSDFNYAINPHK